MQHILQLEQLAPAIKQLQSQTNRALGLVPTMGNLHAGHLHLVAQCKQQGLICAVSIFVNPIQFNNTDDLNNYPRTLQADLDKLKAAGCDLVFTPSITEMYPHGMQDLTQIVPARLSQDLEGAFRPGHFNGMATVVAKLFNLFSPSVAFFGEKDFQQLAIIKQMVADLNMPIKIQAVKTQRNEQGLALSSRNSRLSAIEKELALEIYASLRYISQNLLDYCDSTATIKQQTDRLSKLNIEVEYLALRNAEDFTIPQPDDHHLVVLIAARIGQVRLIDNLSIILKVNHV